MKLGIISQARMTSTRLPGKVLMTLGDGSLLDAHVKRLGAAGVPVIIATTINSSDDPIVEAAIALGCGVYRGSEHDVLSRFAGAAEEYGLDVVARVTSDCPLIDGNLIKASLEKWVALRNELVYLSNTTKRTFPRGFDHEIFSAQALYRVNRIAVASHEREHVTPRFYSGCDSQIVVKTVERVEDDASAMRLTVDTPDDLAMLTELVRLHPEVVGLGFEDIIAILRTAPQVIAMNGKVQQKEF